MSVLPELDPRELERARAVRARVFEVMPAAIPFIESLLREGLIRGWRDIKWAGSREEGEERNARLFAPYALNAGRIESRDLLQPENKGKR